VLDTVLAKITKNICALSEKISNLVELWFFRFAMAAEFKMASKLIHNSQDSKELYLANYSNYLFTLFAKWCGG
jgi:hypothetical protein